MIAINAEIINFLNRTFGYRLTGDYYNVIAMWEDWWRGFNEPFHRIVFDNGSKRRSRDMYTMKMAKKVCEDWAAILINDKTFIKTDDDRASRFLMGDTGNGGVFGSNNFWEQVNNLMERMMWSGTAAVVIRLKNAAVSENGSIIPDSRTRIDLNYIDGGNIIPLSCDNGTITEAAFCSDVCIKGVNKIYLEIHRLEDGEYVIENRVFVADKSGGVLKEDKLPESVPPVIHTRSAIPWFSVCRPAIVNSIKGSNGMGCAVFANAIDNLKGVDIAYNNLNSDIWLGQKKVFMAKSLIEEYMGQKITPDEVNQQLFYYITSSAEDMGAKPLITEHNPDLRVKDNVDCIQAQLDYLSFKVGFGTKHYQFNSGSIVTATQYTGDKQELIQTAHKHFIRVEGFLHDLVKSLLHIGKSFIDSSINDEAAISVTFDQSPLIDENAERERDRADVSDGIMAKWEYRAKWYGESEEEAKHNIPSDDDTADMYPNGVDFE